MKFLPLLLANLGRRKVRTVLTVGSFAVAAFLFGLLATIDKAFSGGADVAGVDRLLVINRVALIQPLPISYRERLRRLPGVHEVTFASWFGGVYRDPKNLFAQFAIEPGTWRTVYPDFVIPDADWRDFVADRQGCVVGEGLARRFGWKKGDRIPLRGTIYEGSWEFNLRAVYAGRRPEIDVNQFWFQRAYLEEKGPEWARGIVGWYTVRLDDPGQALAVSRVIDEGFANSAWETRTQTEKSFAASFVKQLGNIKLLILAVGSVVFFTLLLVTGNTMAIAVRERTTDNGVLKALGASDALVLGLVLAESVLVSALGGAVGILGAELFTRRGDPTGGLLPTFFLPAPAVAAAFLAIVGVGLLAGVLPAVSALRLQVVDALRRV
jgi:putative ABC transport system permease protein